MNNLISVIIPIYNREFTLKRCVDSILGQSWPHWECLLVDDGSTDSTWTICQEYARQDSRFRIFHQENGGVSAARNKGIAEAKGDYIAFVDSDDYVSSSYLQKLWNATQGYDLAVVGLDFKELNQQYHTFSLPEEIISLDQGDPDRLIRIHGMLLVSPCLKLYRRSLIEQYKIRFTEGISTCEDQLFNNEYLLYVDKIHIIPDCLYHIVYTPRSLSSQSMAIKQPLEKYLQISQSLFKLLKSKNQLTKDGYAFFCNCYSKIFWVGLATILREHGRLSFSQRKIRMNQMLALLNKDYLSKATEYPAWRCWFMNHPLFIWFYFELQYLYLRMTGDDRVK